jgi:small subunit ribosomal protein S6
MAETATQSPAPQLVPHQYEGMFLFGAAAASEPQNAINIIRGMIEKHGGQVLVLKRWDERKLAYEVEGQKRGTYFISYFKGPGSAVAHIERDVKLSEQVLRVLITKADHMNLDEMNAVEPQPIQRAEERNPWDRPYEGGGGGGGFREGRGSRDDDRGGDRPDRGGDRPDRGGDRPPREPRAPRAPRREEAPAAEPAKA